MKGFDYTFKKGERVGVVGKNGVGKSTFINILQGIEQPDSGKINIGETVIFGNYSQQGLHIKEDMRVIEYVKNIAESFPLASGGSLSAAQFLELFLFPAEQQYTYISKLSGGEKRRLHLLSILFRNPNFLVLDEPTNDLDTDTLASLEDLLDTWPGTMIVASVGISGAVAAYFVSLYFGDNWRICYYIGGGLGLALLILRVSVVESGMYKNIKESAVSRGNYFKFFTSRERFMRYLKCILVGLPTWYVVGILMTFSNAFAKEMGVKGAIDPGKAIMICYAALTFGDFASGYLSQVMRSRKKCSTSFIHWC